MRPLLVVLSLLAAESLGQAHYNLISPPTTNPPSARRSSSLARQTLDGGNEIFWTFGGFNGSALSDLRGLDLDAGVWLSPVASGTAPAARERHSLGYDPVTGVVVLVGGMRVQGLMFNNYDDVYLYDPRTSVWTRPPLPAVRPNARCDATLVYAPSAGGFLYFGGGAQSLSGGVHTNDLWRLDVRDGGVTWAQLLPAGGAPSPRGAPCADYDPVRRQLLVFGGENDAAAPLGDFWAYDLNTNTWSSRTTTGAPTARAFCAAAYDPRAERLFIYGGQGTGGAVLGGNHSFDSIGGTWATHLQSVGLLADSSAAFSALRGAAVLFGGRSGTSTYVNTTRLARYNTVPVVDAGPGGNVGENILLTLSGSATDSDGDSLSPSWTQIQGPAVTLAQPTTFTPQLTTPRVTAPTLLRFMLTVNDGWTTGQREVLYTVDDTVNEQPAADAGPDQTVAGGATVSLTGSGSDPNNNQPLAFGWSQLSGPGVVLSAPASASTGFTAPSGPVPSALTFRLTVTDALGATGTDDVLVQVGAVDAGTAPSATGLTLTPNPAYRSSTLQRTYVYADSDGHPEQGSTTRWFRNNVEVGALLNSPAVTSSNLARGQSWYFTVTPCDTTTLCGPTQGSSTLVISNSAPTASGAVISPASPSPGGSLSLTYAFSDVDGDAQSGSTVRWFRNGVEQTALMNQLSVSPGLMSGDQWSCSVQPSDGTDFGMAVACNTVTVAAAADAGSDGGATDGGVADGGVTDGGVTDGGVTDGGVTDGGVTDGGATDGGATDGGATDGGATDGGATDGGVTDGGATDGGATDGGATDGGATDGGAADGGTTDGGATDGGATDGGNSDGGNSDGGNNDGGTTDGGTNDAGNGGNLDGGTSGDPQQLNYQLGCGCGASGPGTAMLWLFGLWLVARRIRRRA